MHIRYALTILAQVSCYFWCCCYCCFCCISLSWPYRFGSFNGFFSFFKLFFLTSFVYQPWHFVTTPPPLQPNFLQLQLRDYPPIKVGSWTFKSVFYYVVNRPQRRKNNLKRYTQHAVGNSSFGVRNAKPSGASIFLFFWTAPYHMQVLGLVPLYS